ncbi:MAG: D-alanyl-D-alanine carboxypeptidase [Defluviitaleaceae bacterium]|nr:D-alanyl-D-alanine carboxypeptidase [Defluviitaleaceae bacterium]
MKKIFALLIVIQLLICARPFAYASASDIAGGGSAPNGQTSVAEETPQSPAGTETGVPDAGPDAPDTDADSGAPVPPDLTADSAVLMDAKTGIVIYSKDMYATEYPASITKVLTALVALQMGEDNIDQRISFSAIAVNSLPWDSSSIGMYPGDTLTFSQALYGMLLNSANEVANAVAEHFGGTIDNFVGMMNAEAKALGAKNSNFVNPHGLYDPNHYTCAYDMALFMREAVKHPDFVQVISTKSSSIPPTEMQPETRPLNNSDKMILPGKYYDEDVVGGKTGYTDEAQHTLVTYAKRDGIELIACVMHDAKNMDYADTKALLDYGFEDYHDVSLLDAGYAGTADVSQPDPEGGAGVSKLRVCADGGLEGLYPLCVDAGSVTLRQDIDPSLEAPVEQGSEVGKLTVLYGGAEIGSVSLYAAESVPLALASPQPSPVETPAVLGAVDDTAAGAGGGRGFLAVVLIILTIIVALAVILVLTAALMRRARRRRRRGRAMKSLARPRNYRGATSRRARRKSRKLHVSDWTTRRY